MAKLEDCKGSISFSAKLPLNDTQCRAFISFAFNDGWALQANMVKIGSL